MTPDLRSRPGSAPSKFQTACLFGVPTLLLLTATGVLLLLAQGGIAFPVCLAALAFGLLAPPLVSTRLVLRHTDESRRAARILLLTLCGWSLNFAIAAAFYLLIVFTMVA